MGGVSAWGWITLISISISNTNIPNTVLQVLVLLPTLNWGPRQAATPSRARV
jgi:hypothetical protein